jgi:formyl-CoA transferase
LLNVVRLLEVPENDFSTVEKQKARSDELDDRLREWIAQRPAEECLHERAVAEVVTSWIFSVKDIVEDPIYRELGDIVSVSDSELGEVRMQGCDPPIG